MGIVSAANRINTPIGELSGVGKTRAEQLHRLGIYSVRDLLYHFPRAYENRGDILPLGAFDTSNERAYKLTVATEVKDYKIKRGMTISKFRAFDESGSVEVVFFNSPYVKSVFHVGNEFRFFGKLSFSKSRVLSLTSPKYEAIIDGLPLEDLTPLYPLTEGLSSKMLRKLTKIAINDFLPFITDFLPEDTSISLGLCSLTYALKNIHFPESPDALRKARKRLAYDELFLFALNISFASGKRRTTVGVPFSATSLKPLLELLPYELTDSQKAVVNDIYRDTVLSKNEHGEIPAMSRIIVGDVGCGKTVCAAIALYLAVKSGYQGALMVPTEILANQHFEELSDLLGRLGISVELLTGSLPQKEKARIYKTISDGTAQVIVGTHALLSDKISFARLGLIITDEQHRFGVNQRGVLKEKECAAHMLVMSATPIPRTLALALYGDLDISRITEMPKGRQRVDTFIVDEGYRTRVNEFIKKQVSLGGQCYVVCPSIEKSDDDEIGFSAEDILKRGEYDPTAMKNAVEYTEELIKSLPGLSIACLHGKMKAQEKDAVIGAFARNEINVLVSTTVIEVGVNVPNATLMIVENADRFGLSQLHQLRGRVGRGSRKSYCILISDSKSEKAKSRLEVMRTTYDGYEIADKDLLLRGPGDFFSQNSGDNIRQSGGFEFKLASACEDEDLLASAFSAAKSLFERDPELRSNENKLLRDMLTLNQSSISSIS